MSDVHKVAALKHGGIFEEWSAQMEASSYHSRGTRIYGNKGLTQKLDPRLEKAPDSSKLTEGSKNKLAKARLLLCVSCGLVEICAAC
jgi:hypothetical protein